ncbi:hypothetical protein [Oceanicella actignis]|nr:hypothetical protein [Oceanicella actignis]
MMEGLLYIVMAALVVIPMFKLLPGYGINPLWALICAIPLGLIVLLWVMAARADRRAS